MVSPAWQAPTARHIPVLDFQTATPIKTAQPTWMEGSAAY